ncbi:alpha-L-fucosidase [Auraticoccus sp. F435]|uniref:alpha-L-fucosidase n=1 Tax=Auraticoccus cholistanensis TaxID=2656650 RepID=A0A6A9UWM7_9ACTN|nr:alpha-L-fucosidase [Auraticoccus cholistanensis]
MSTPGPDARWFDEARFGLFLHFGLYSVAARHEWVMHREEMEVADYERYAEVFDADRYDATAVVARAAAAGMRYVVLTSKHHDGFCLFDSAQTDYTSVRSCGRDLVAETVAACRAAGLRVGLYHSLLDWHHPDYTVDAFHPRRHHPDWAELDAGKDFSRYVDYLHAQVRELLTGYGPIDYLFFDFTQPDGMAGLPGRTSADWRGEELLALCRELQPQMLVNDRLGIPADLVTPEQYQPTAPMEQDGVRLRWEACQTINGSWGYDRDNTADKSVRQIVEMLVQTVSCDGNLLLNVGPDGRGAIPPRDAATLDAVAAWMELHRDSVHGAGASEHTAPSGTVYTQRGDRLYVHLLSWPFAHLHLPGLAGQVRFARFLHDGSEVRTEVHEPGQEAHTMRPGGQPPGTLTLLLPTVRPDVAVPVVELRLAR